jgi:flagellar hook-length control protein FliK
MNSDPLTRAADGQLAAAANSGAGGSAKLDAGGDRATGENQGERGGDRQAQPNLNPRGPSITFSLDGLPNATLATVGTSAVPSPITSSPLLSQSLTLLGQPSQWAEPLAQRLAGLATQGANTAEIRLHPPSLGQLDVRITLANDQATLFVASANPEVREALQQALPRLDDLLSGLGIELAESEIAERQADGFQAEGGDNQPDSEPNSGGEPGEQSSEQPGSNRLGMLDTWA